MNESKGDPYVIWKKTIYAWMMCCKRTGMFNGRLTRDIALMIAQYVLPDFSGEVCWSKMFKKARLVLMPLFLTPRELYPLDRKLLCYRLVWVSSTIISPCPECLRPVTSENRCPNTNHMEFKSLFNEEIDCLRKIAILPRFAEELNK